MDIIQVPWVRIKWLSIVNMITNFLNTEFLCFNLSFVIFADWWTKLFGVGWDWVHLVHWPLIGLLYQPRMIDDECEAVGGMRIGWRKPAPVPLCPPQIPLDLTWAWTWAAMEGSQWLTTWTMARPAMTNEPKTYPSTPRQWDVYDSELVYIL
jgi:hypothetical protein